MPIGTERILFVEDNAGIRTMAARALGTYGFTVVAARDGSEAIAIAAREQFDLLVTDIVMPGMNGRMMAEQLCATYPGLKVVFTSGVTGDSELLQGIRTGDTPFVQKPYTMESLARTIRGALDGE